MTKGSIKAFGASVVGLACVACASPAPSGAPLVHATLGAFAFDAPASWRLVPTGNPGHYETDFGFLVAPPATASETCGPDYVPGAGACDDTVEIPAGSAVLSFRVFVNGACHPDAAGQLAEDRASGWAATSVSGLTAAVDHPALGDVAATWTWQMTKPSADPCNVYEVKARLGPKSAALAPDVEAVVASLRITAAAAP